MSNDYNDHEPDSGNGNGGAVIVRPQQQVGVAAEQQRAIAEIQAALTVAKASRRDEADCVDRIKTACQRIGLAEKAEYVYDRGGTEITGPTIDLLTVIANCWGNIKFGFRELTQRSGANGSAGESTVETFAWDLETNSQRVVTFTVAHKRVTKRATTNLTDPRDIYELVANQAQRRVRACLEAVIPPDVVEDARFECRATLEAKVDITPAGVAKMLAAFAKIGVSKESVVKRLGRRVEAIQPAQFVRMQAIYKSIQDGMSKPEDWFEVAESSAEEQPKSATEAAKDALKGQAAKPEAATIDGFKSALAECADIEAVNEAEADFAGRANESDKPAISGMAQEARDRMRAKSKGGKQKELTGA